MAEEKDYVTGKWSREEVHVLKEMFSHRTNEQIADVLKRPVTAVRSKAYKLRLKKAIDRMTATNRKA